MAFNSPWGGQTQYNPITGKKQAAGGQAAPWDFISGLVNPQQFPGPIDPATGAAAEIKALVPEYNKKQLDAANKGGAGGFQFNLETSSPAAEIYGQLGEEANAEANAIMGRYGLAAWEQENENKRSDKDRAWQLALNAMSGGLGGSGGGGGGGMGGGSGSSGGGGGSSVDMEIAQLEAELAGMTTPSSSGGANAADFYLDIRNRRAAEEKAKQASQRSAGGTIARSAGGAGNRPDPKFYKTDQEYQEALQNWEMRRQSDEAENARRRRSEDLRNAARSGTMPTDWINDLTDAELAEWRKYKGGRDSIQEQARSKDAAARAALQKKIDALYKIRDRSRTPAPQMSKDPYQDRLWSWLEKLLGS